MKRLWPFTPRGAGALVLAVACFVAADQLALVGLVYFGVLLAAAVAASTASLFLSRRAETVSRSLSPDVAVAGGEVAVTVQVAIRTALPTAAGRWRETLPAAVTGDAHGEVPALGSGLRGDDRVVSLSYRVGAVRRGIHPLGPLQLTSFDPFGLVRRGTLVGEPTRIVVAPAVVGLSPLTGYAGATGGTLHATSTQLGQGADNLTPRHYVPGDSRRRIHWRASAHRDTLMVRQEEQESTPEATVVLDLGRRRWNAAAAEAPGLDAAFENAVSMCVSAVARLVHDGYAVDIVDGDGTPLWNPIEGADDAEVEAVIARFAALTAQGGDELSHLARLFAGASTGPVVLVTGMFAPADASVVAAIPSHSALALLLAAAPQGDALSRAEEAGWHTASIGPDQDLAVAWADAAGPARGDAGGVVDAGGAAGRGVRGAGV